MNRLTKQLLCMGLISMVLWGCGSSAEYTTAKMAIKEENWEKAEEYLIKALEVEPENAEVMVQIGYHVHAKINVAKISSMDCLLFNLNEAIMH